MLKNSTLSLAVMLTSGVAFVASTAAAQAPPPHFAITDVRIVTGDGSVIDGGTIVVQKGLIDAVGAGISVPPGAWTIDGSGMTAYPGLIDALSTVGLPMELHDQPAGGRGGGGGESGDDFARGPEDRPATFTWITAADHIDAADSRVAEWREAGFTTVVAAPQRGLFPGQASIIDLAGERPNDMVVVTPVALPVSFNKGRAFDGYPGSIMGIIAYVKQVLLDAQHYETAWSIYESSPAGTERPAYDRTLEPLRAAVRDQWPVLLPADWAREIERTLRIARTVGVRPILYGGRQAWAVADTLAAADVPVLINLDWPEIDPDGDPVTEESLQMLRYRDRAPTSPAALHAAGVRFAFYSGDVDGADEMIANARLAVRAGLPADAALHAMTLGAAEIFGVDDRMGSIEVGKIANITLTDGDLFAAGTRIHSVIVDGQRFDSSAPEDLPTAAEEEAGVAEAYEPVPMVRDRGPVSEHPVTVVRNATVMTVSGAGTLENASVLIRDGRIAEVGSNVDTPSGAHVIDATGKWVTPGIVDAHSHVAAESINEGSVSVSAMVGIRDVLNPDQVSIYRALGGGVTSANILHGSANPIGGQNAVVKLRWGANAQGLMFEGAPEGIKFALGENTKRDRDPDRYPNSRMGVQDVIRQAFLDAQAYQAEGRRYEQALAAGDEGMIPPRRDLKLEPLVEILDGTRLVHAHSYRADEILQLLRTAEDFGFRIATLQHVLEGYRVADEIAAHGAGASTFSDWWAYKVEAYEAIPHNAALMTDRGVLVSINSDSGEEMRHLTLEAAKTIKWGGNTRDEAMRLVTLNPAIQLGIDDRVGSLEVGKDADLVIYSADPLSNYAVVEQTIVDGQVYFDRRHDAETRAALAAEKEMLMQRQGVTNGSTQELER